VTVAEVEYKYKSGAYWYPKVIHMAYEGDVEDAIVRFTKTKTSSCGCKPVILRWCVKLEKVEIV